MTIATPTEIELLFEHNGHRHEVNRSLQPLSWNDQLANAADTNTQKNLQNTTFEHSNPVAIDQQAGYQFSGGWAAYEIHGWGNNYVPPGKTLAEVVEEGYEASPSHNDAILSPLIDEAGVSYVIPGYNKDSNLHYSTTELAGNGDTADLFGLVYRDYNGDHDYDAGEGIGGVTVTGTAPGVGAFSVVTDANGYWESPFSINSGDWIINSNGHHTHVRVGEANRMVNLSLDIKGGASWGQF